MSWIQAKIFFSLLTLIELSRFDNQRIRSQGIPEQAEVAPVAQPPVGTQPVAAPTHDTQPAVPPSGPNANPLDLFPQVEILLQLKYSLKKNKRQFDCSSAARVSQQWARMQVPAAWIFYAIVNRF